jgi:hypothetical protein
MPTIEYRGPTAYVAARLRFSGHGAGIRSAGSALLFAALALASAPWSAPARASGWPIASYGWWRSVSVWYTGSDSPTC